MAANDIKTIPHLPLAALLAAMVLKEESSTGIAFKDAGDVVGKYYNGTRTVPPDTNQIMRSLIVKLPGGGFALRVAFQTSTEDTEANTVGGEKGEVATLADCIYEAEDGLPCLLVFLIAA